jgi:CRISPR-associated protein Cas1
MGWRSLYLSNKHYLELSIDQKMLTIQKENEKPAHFRLEDINFILIDSYNFRISGRLLEAIAKNHISLVLASSKDHMPCLQLTNPYSGHHQLGKIITIQSKLTRKEKLEYWKKIIDYKIRSQGILIDEREQAEIISSQAHNAKSTASLLGVEGSWGRYYWSRLVSEREFSRVAKVYKEPNDSLNSFLNYTYAIIRARIASAIAENGLLPMFSLFHRRENNPFALADDLIEPYRWCADMLFREHIEEIIEEDIVFLDVKHKKLALSVLHQKVYIPSLERTFSLDDAIRIGIKGFRRAVLNKNNDLLEEIFCHIAE